MSQFFSSNLDKLIKYVCYQSSAEIDRTPTIGLSFSNYVYQQVKNIKVYYKTCQIWNMT